MMDVKARVMVHWELINDLARRRFGEKVLAEEAALQVLDQLSLDDWRRLRSYDGSGSFSAFLSAVSWRLLEDFARQRFGRRRPPGWIRRLGGAWQRLFRLLCLQRLPVYEAVAVHRQQWPEQSEQEILAVARKIRQEVTDCGSHQGLEVSLEEDGPSAASATIATGDPVGSAVEETERRKLFSILFEEIFAEDRGATEKRLAILAKLRIPLDGEDRVLLKLCFQDGLNVTEAGRLLGKNRFQVHGRLRRVLATIRKACEEADLDEALLDYLRG